MSALFVPDSELCIDIFIFINFHTICLRPTWKSTCVIVAGLNK